MASLTSLTSPQGRPSLSSLGSLSSLSSAADDSFHGVLDSLMGEGHRMQPKYALEDYIYEVQARDRMANEHLQHPHRESGGGAAPGAADGDDVYAQLQQKEKDLILAAELGKALLEKNEELSRQNERIAEEFSQKLEVGSNGWRIARLGGVVWSFPVAIPMPCRFNALLGTRDDTLHPNSTTERKTTNLTFFFVFLSSTRLCVALFFFPLAR